MPGKNRAQRAAGSAIIAQPRAARIARPCAARVSA